MKQYSANKILVLLAIVLGGAMSITFVWADLPKETGVEVLKLVAEAAGVWVVVSAMTFVMS